LINKYYMKALRFFFIIVIFSFYYTNTVFSETTNNQTKNNDNDNNINDEDITKNLLTTIGIVIPATITLFLAFRQYRKEKEKQLLEYKNKREFEYDVKLRQQRIGI
jgi:heme/copper-type cytochrome/quinol oxidase subunit 2